MARFPDVQEELRISAPELVLTAVVEHSFTTSCIFVPLARELFRECCWQFLKIHCL